MYESSSFEMMPNQPNVPTLSAGMIPVKWDGSYWVITTQDDTEWYDYSSGKFAHVMLNDGTYQSELIRDMTNKKLADENVGGSVPDDPNIRGTIFTWIPRFAYKENGEIKYAPTEIQPGGEWVIPDMFTYTVSDETKPDFSLSGVWLQKDVDTSYTSKITAMQKEEGIYGFLAHTKPVRITSPDTKAIQKYIVGVGVPDDPFNDITNTNRIILKIVNTRKYEPIKANVIHNTVDQKLEIKVTYTKNGISKILDEYGNEMTYTETDGIILADTGDKGLAKGTYYFTIIDNNGNKKELNIDIVVDSLFKVAYINGTDNMIHWYTYNKTQETKTSEENALLNEIKVVDTSTTYSRAIKDSNNAITAIGENNRTSTDEQIYLYSKYKANSTKIYSWTEEKSTLSCNTWYNTNRYAYQSVIPNTSTGEVTFTNSINLSKYLTTYDKAGKPTVYYSSSVLPSYSVINSWPSKYNSSGDYYKFVCVEGSAKYEFKVYTYTRKSSTTYSKGDFMEYTSGTTDQYPNNDRSGSYWYVRNSLMKKYKLYKYDENLRLKSTYDVDTKALTTVPIDISNKESNKVKLTLNASGSTYKTYISNDNATWQEVTDITSGTPKELNVDGWDKLYIKIETNTSRIDNIDIAYYKD